jgi:tetratricopeptide (TPR) repeat protein
MPQNWTAQKVLILAGSVLLIAALLLANKKKPSSDQDHLQAGGGMHEHTGLEPVIDSIRALLPGKTLLLVQEQEKNSAGSQKAAALDSLVRLFAGQRQPVAAAYYSGKLAEVKNTSAAYTDAGTRYYVSAQFSPNLRPELFDRALHAFEKALELDKDNLDAKVKLGVCLVEGTNEPMKGITLLREVVEADSTNIEAHLNLGLFAVQSGQYDKAIERFSKILAINPEYLEAYIYLGQTFANKGDKKKAIETLEKYKSLNKDELINEEVTKYINELKNS